MFSYNLKRYRKANNLTQDKLSDEINELLNTSYTKDNVRSWEKGTNPKIDTIEAIAKILNIPVQYLFDDSKEALSKIIKKELPEMEDAMSNIKKVSFLKGYVGAGSAGEVVSRYSDNFLYIDRMMIAPKYLDSEIKALTVVGDSMIPFVDHGDIVLFTEIKRDRYNLPDGKYIITTINGTMVKNLTFKATGDIVISSCNKAYKDEIIKADESQEYLDIVGFVVSRILKS